MTRSITYVKWRDASHGMDEYDISRMGLSELEEVGWLVKEDEESLTLAMEHEGGGDTTRLWLTIPKTGIVERKDVSFERALPSGKRRK